MVEPEFSKLATRVRFPSSAPSIVPSVTRWIAGDRERQDARLTTRLHHAGVAQQTEHRPCSAEIAGSTPAAGSISNALPNATLLQTSDNVREEP